MTRLPLRILVAEDNPVVQTVCRRMIEHLGHKADVVANGRQVLEAVERQRYDVILMDLNMPEMDGIEATRQLVAKYPATERPRIIALTGSALAADRERCLAAGVDDYLAKPVQLRVLDKALGGVRSTEAAEAAVPVLDPKTIADLRMLEEQSGVPLLDELIEGFLRDASARLALLGVALAEKNRADTRTLAHGLKGSCGVLGASGLVALFGEIERLAPEDLEGAAARFARVAPEVERVKAALLTLRRPAPS